MKIPFASASLVLAALLSACSTTGGDVPSVSSMLSEATGQNGRACVWQSRIQGYGVLKNNLISIDGMQNYYLATVLPGCLDLQTSMGALFSSNFHELCGQSMDRIVTREGSCTIGQMYEFESREQAFDTYNALLEKRQEIKSAAKNPPQAAAP